jgi:hypothetical protein
LNPDDFKPTNTTVPVEKAELKAPIGGANGFKRIEIEDDSSENEESTEIKQEDADKIAAQADSIKEATKEAEEHAKLLDAKLKEQENK